jgi:tetratricopeptide (TPR) repeat protein/DNA-binding CsgD family transcriptional regulator
VKTKIVLYILLLLGKTFYSQDRTNKQKSIDSLIAIATNDRDLVARSGNKELLRICTEIYYQSKDIGYDKGIMNGIMGLAGAYISEQNFEEVIKNIPEGLALAEKSEDYLMWSKMLLIQGVAYAALGYDKKSKESLNKSLYIVDHFPVGKRKYFLKSAIYNTIATNLRNDPQASPDSIRFYFQKAYEESKMEEINPFRNIRVGSYSLNVAAVYIKQNKLSEAEKYMKEFEELMKNEKDKSLYIYFYINKGWTENKKRNFTESIQHFNRSIQLIHEYKVFGKELKDIYYGLSEDYLGLSDYKNQALYLSKLKKVTDSISTSEKKILNGKVLAQNENINNKENIQKDNYIIAAILILVAVCITFIFFVESQKAKKNRIIKNNDLPAIEEMQIFPDEVSAQHDKERQEKDVHIIRKLIELVQSKDKSFHLKFSEAFPEFDQKLLTINPTLTHSDLEYCALMKLKFETKEIAQYKNVTINSVESKKYRLRKKLNIPTNIDIYTWMLKVI